MLCTYWKYTYHFFQLKILLFCHIPPLWSEPSNGPHSPFGFEAVTSAISSQSTWPHVTRICSITVLWHTTMTCEMSRCIINGYNTLPGMFSQSRWLWRQKNRAHSIMWRCNGDKSRQHMWIRNDISYVGSRIIFTDTL